MLQYTIVHVCRCNMHAAICNIMFAVGPETDHDELIAKSFPMVTILKHEAQKRVSARAGEAMVRAVCGW
jgi:hypothetical protein